jgi:hypothetical protein
MRLFISRGSVRGCMCTYARRAASWLVLNCEFPTSSKLISMAASCANKRGARDIAVIKPRP